MCVYKIFYLFVVSTSSDLCWCDDILTTLSSRHKIQTPILTRFTVLMTSSTCACSCTVCNEKLDHPPSVQKKVKVTGRVKYQNPSGIKIQRTYCKILSLDFNRCDYESTCLGQDARLDDYIDFRRSDINLRL